MQHNFFLDVICKDSRFHSLHEIHDTGLLEPVTHNAVLALIADAKTSLGIDLMVWETYRSEERQVLLFEQKATKLKTVGVHHFGLAADIVKSVHGVPSWKGDFSFMPKLCKKHGLISGLDWGQPGKKHSFVDPCHVQRITLNLQKGLFSGAYYPDFGYNPYGGK